VCAQAATEARRRLGPATMTQNPMSSTLTVSLAHQGQKQKAPDWRAARAVARTNVRELLCAQAATEARLGPATMTQNPSPTLRTTTVSLADQG